MSDTQGVGIEAKTIVEAHLYERQSKLSMVVREARSMLTRHLRSGYSRDDAAVLSGLYNLFDSEEVLNLLKGEL